MRWLRLIWFWLRSTSARQAARHHRHVLHLLNYQRDRLTPGTAAPLDDALRAVRKQLFAGRDPVALDEQVDRLRALARDSLIDTWKHRRRELFDMLLVAFTAILSVRTFFAQPMTIPTGSMQPTLYGITVENLLEVEGANVPTGLSRFIERWVHGRRFIEFTARAPGRLEHVDPPEPVAPFLAAFPSMRKQRFQLGGDQYTILFPPTELPPLPGVPSQFLLFVHAGLNPARLYWAGETIIKLLVNSGDHILVDRFTVNFRRPHRGEIVVFHTQGLPGVPESEYYLKRLVGLEGETISIGDDRRVRVNGVALDRNTPHFEEVYSFSGPPRNGQYNGHMNDAVARQLRMRRGWLAPRFPDERAELTVRPGHCLVLGDNTLASEDGRRWGDIPLGNLIGRYWLVYWPVSERIGWVRR